MRRYASSVRFVRSVWPLVSGWNAVDSRWSIPSMEVSSIQNLDAKVVPLSVTISLGRPWLATTFRVNAYASSLALWPSLLGWLLVFLVCWLFTTQMLSYSLLVSGSLDGGSLTMRSHDIAVQGASGTGSGWSLP